MKWLDLTNDLTRKAFRELEIGQVLIFDFEGSPIHIKIMRKYKGKIWGKKNYLYSLEEVTVKDKK